MIAQFRRLMRPPRIVAVTRRPAGWFAVGRRQLELVIAWAEYDDSRIVGLVADRYGLRPAVGWGWYGYLPAAPFSPTDVQREPPQVVFPVADLNEAIGDISTIWTSEAQGAIYARLRAAAELEWAGKALQAFVVDPERFLRRHLELLTEHGQPAQLSDRERDWLANLTTNQHAQTRAEDGLQREKPS